MDKKNKIFFLIMALLIAGAVGVTYWRIMIKKDYVIEAQTDCDPTVDECFIWECDPESTEEGEACTGDPEEDSWYFQVVRRNASNIPLCDPETDESCEALVCGENEPNCEYEFCTEENMEDQYASACNDPAEYILNNTEEDEEDLSADEAECDLEVDPACEVFEEDNVGDEAEIINEGGEVTGRDEAVDSKE